VKSLEELLDRHAELLGSHPVDGCAMEPVDVRLKDPDKVVWVPPRRLLQREEQIVDEEVDELVKVGAITRSTSPFNIPIVVVEQKGKSTVCFDFRKLNKHVDNSRYPLPRIRVLLERLHGVSFFSPLVLARGYHHLPLTSSSRRFMAFSTQKGKYEWRRLPFRVVNGPMVSQETIAQIMEKLNWSYVLAYSHNIIVITKGDYENHLEVLQQVLERLRK
jgi:hypothetical protein